MEIIPAIDLREGFCARILDADESILKGRFTTDPVEQAVILKEQGAEVIHITDFDGAFSGRLYNLDIIEEIIRTTELKVQHSGGCRTMDDIKALLDIGVHKVVINSQFIKDKALTEKAFSAYGDIILPEVDARDGVVASEGFETENYDTVKNWLSYLQNIGFSRYIYTDLRRTGAMRDPSFDGVSSIMSATKMKCQLAGGISTYSAISHLKDMGVESLIIGKALYTAAIELKQAMEIARV